MTTLNEVAVGLAPAVDAMGNEAFPGLLGAALRDLVGADDVTVLHYRESHMPDVLHFTPPGEAEKTTLDTYLTGPFLLDPFYRAATLEGRFGVFLLKQLAPVGFRESEYYRTWYRNCGFKDEVGLLVSVDDGFINIAIGLTHTGARFGRRHCDLLSQLFPLIEAITQQHWAGSRDRKPSEGNLRHRLHSALAAFGSSVLTRRERQVTELVLLGNSTRIIAEKLKISTETVKLHRKHAYAKLDVSSQSELFILFMEALAHSADEAGTDPLIAYHAKPQR